MLEIPIVRWGQDYESVEKESVCHLETGEELAAIHQANPGLVKLDSRRARRARELLRGFSIPELIERCGRAAEAFLENTLPLGNEAQTPEQFCALQSATTGLPERHCAQNMQKNAFVLSHLGEILDALGRYVPYDVLSSGHGCDDRGLPVSYQAQSPVLGMVLPSNSPGVHTLWLPVIALQIGLMLKPGSREPWTPYRLMEALVESGIPREVFSIYPGGAEVGAALVETCDRAMVFGGSATVRR
ncbi:MAG TPA: aldehyde dehydrogenase family protein, partial [Planctomycetaceae bacterium]|nr:aldehyde dehydrogenase family protein [Planctomycetaceae bacterium]